jgi:hypothetical protein
MNSSADEKGLRRNRRDKTSQESVVDLLMRFRKEGNLHPEFRYIRKWGIEWDDPHFQAIAKRLDRIWPRLSADDRDLYLRTAESIAEAEKAKNAWNPKAVRGRYARLSKNAVAAAKLANEIGAMFPPPWTGERAPIGDLMQGLAAFVSGSLDATYPADTTIAVYTARAFIRMTKRRLSRKAGGMHWELIRDLAWLASQKKVEPNERTVRRYLDEGRMVKNPAEECWKRNWDLIRNACGLAPEGASEPFKELMKRYLNAPFVSGASPESAARKRR